MPFPQIGVCWNGMPCTTCDGLSVFMISLWISSPSFPEDRFYFVGPPLLYFEKRLWRLADRLALIFCDGSCLCTVSAWAKSPLCFQELRLEEKSHIGVGKLAMFEKKPLFIQPLDGQKRLKILVDVPKTQVAWRS